MAYPRRVPEHTEQGRTLISYAESDFINAADENDWYRLGVPFETRAYELTGIRRADVEHPFTVEEIADAAANAAVLPYEAEPNHVAEQKRLLDATRTLYWNEDLAGSIATRYSRPARAALPELSDGPHTGPG